MKDPKKFGFPRLRRALALLITLTLLFGEVGPLASFDWGLKLNVNAEEATGFAGGDGLAENSAYEIATEAQLRYFATLKQEDTQGKYFRLTENITLTTNENWKPVVGFSGHFDGNGHTVTGLKIDAEYSEAADVAMFGTVYAGASIRNLTLVNAAVNATQSDNKAMNVAALVAKIEYTADSNADTLIDNCAVIGTSTVSVTANALEEKKYTGVRVGGLIGNLDANEAAKGGTIIIRNCFNEADVTVTATNGGGSVAVGGIGGYLGVNGTNVIFYVQNCGNAGTITGTATALQSYAGGIAGWCKSPVDEAASQPASDNCYSIGMVSGGKANGAIWGQGTKVTSQKWGCYAQEGTYGTATYNGTELTATQITDGTLLNKLNAGTVDFEGAFKWEANAQGYPVPTAPAQVQVSWEVPANGTLTVTREDSTAVNSGDSIAAGTKLTVTATPADGYILKELTVNGTAVTVTNGAYELTLPEEAVAITAVFEEALWENTAVEPAQVDGVYQITKAEELAWMIGKGQSKRFLLTADIDLSGRAWTPIAKNEVTLNGNGHTISNMKITAGNTTKTAGTLYAGLFADTWNSSITNLRLANVNIDVTGESDTTVYVGAIAGQATGNTVIDRCYIISGTIKATANIVTTTSPTKNLGLGGLVGNVSGTSADVPVQISSCYNAAALVAHNGGTTGQYYVGGIAANIARTNVINCANIGTMTATGTVHQARLGGVVGVSNANCTLKNSYSAYLCDVTGLTKNSETYNAITNKGVLARGEGAEATSTYAPGAKNNKELLSALNDYVGASEADLAYWTPIAADGYPVPTAAILVVPQVQVSWTAPANGTLTVTREDSTAVNSGDSIAVGTKLTVTATPADGFVLEELTVNSTAVTVTDNTYVLTLPEENVVLVAKYIAVDKWTEVASAFAGGKGTESEPFEIATARQLAYLATRSDTANKYYKLTANIDLSAYEWVPIMGFAGHFDGDGHTVKGLNIENTASASDIGLFGTVLGGATVKNVILENVNINVTVAATAGRVSAAAVVGRIDIITKAGEVVIDNCAVIGSSAISVTTNHTAWAILGLGGIVGTAVPNNSSGASTVRIINCFNAADLTATENGGKIQIELGGIAGAAYCDDKITGVHYYMVNCGNIGDLTASSSATKEVGGLAGRFRSQATDGTSTVNNCYSTGTITDPSELRPIVYTKGGNGQTISNTYYYYADTVSNNVSSTALTAEQLTDGTLLGYLNTNKATVTGAFEWIANGDNYPVPAAPVDVQLSWTVPEKGTIVVTKGTDSQVANPEVLPSGTALHIQITPIFGYRLKTLKVNGEAVTVTGNTYAMTLPRVATTIEAEFEAVDYRWTDTEVVASAFAGGYGTESEPFEIATAGQLAYLATRSDTEGKYYKLTADIDLSAHQWVPIKGFAGHFDGDGYIISGVTVDEAYSVISAVGFFGTVNPGATIRNVVLKDLYIAAQQTADKQLYVGGLIGQLDYSSGKTGGVLIDNCTVVGSSTITVTANSITAEKYTYVTAGGILGYLNADAAGTVTLRNCYNEADISVTTETSAVLAVGGIAGLMNSNVENATFTVANCGNIGSITASGTANESYIGGVVGRFRKGNAKTVPTIENCYNAGAETGTWTNVGSVLGQRASTTVTNCYGITWTNAAGSLFAPGTPLTAEEITDGTLLGHLNANKATVTGAFDWEPNTDNYPVPVEPIKSLAGSGTKDAPYEIGTVRELIYFAGLTQTDTQDKYYKLTADITLTEKWVPIWGFAGHFDGDGHTISGLTIDSNYAVKKDLGLFGMIYAGASIRNVKLKNVNINVTQTGNNAMNVGALVGKIEYIETSTENTVIDNCSVSGSISVTANALTANSWTGIRIGGLIGNLDANTSASGTVTVCNCFNEANVTLTATTGGGDVAMGGVAGAMIVNGNNATFHILNCGSIGSLSCSETVTRSFVGGIAGWTKGQSTSVTKPTVDNCYSAGTMSGTIGGSYTSNIGNIAAQSTNVTFDWQRMYGLVSGGSIPGTVITEIQVTDGTLLGYLNENAKTIEGALDWTVNNAAFPVPEQSDGLVKLEWAEPASGTIAVKQGDTVLTNPARVEPNTEVTVTVTTNSGCTLIDLTVGGVSVFEQMTENSYTFTVMEDTAIAAVFEYTSEVTIYVRPNADGEGTGAEAAPYTLQQALDRIEALRADTQAADQSITVCLLGGTYRLAETLTLNASYASDTGRVIFESAPGANAVISGGVDISGGWTDENGDGIYEKQLSPVDGAYPQFRDLYIGGQRATLARTADYTFASNYTNNLTANSLTVATDALSGVTGDVTDVEISLLVEWKHQIFQLATADASGEITLNENQWYLYNRYDSTKKALGDYTYYLQNHVSFLDEPGEFYYDQASGKVYYKPYTNQDMTSATVEYGALDVLVKLENTKNIVFDGITFTGTTANWISQNGMPGQMGATKYGKQYFGADVGEPIPCAAIFGDYATDITVTNCVFQELGGSGVLFQYGAKNISITGNRMKNLGASAVSVGVAQVMWNQAAKKNGVDGDHFVVRQVYPGQSENVTISNNYINNIGLVLNNAPAVAVKRSENLSIRYNTIVHVPYSGITAGWGMNYDFDTITKNDNSIQWDKTAFFKNLTNAEIAYNYIEDYMHSTNDGGAIYVNGANAEPTSNEDLGNTIHHNYIRAGAHTVINVGIYHDGAASNWKTTNNFIDGVTCDNGPIFFQDDVSSQYTHYITAANNYSTAKKISKKNGAATKDSLGNRRENTVSDNTLFTHRGEATAEALAIMNGAGLQASYQYLEAPMAAELKVDDNAIHSSVTKGYFSSDAITSVLRFALTNNTGVKRTYTLTFAGLPTGVTVQAPESVTVKAGQTKLLEAVITYTETVSRTAVDLIVQDDTGRKTEYARAFTVEAKSGLANSTVSLFDIYGTSILPGEALTMNFFVLTTNISSDVSTNSYYALISRPNQDGTVTVLEKVYSSQWESRNEAYAISTDLVARQMTDTLQVQIFSTETNEPVSRVKTDSIKEYVLRALDSTQEETAKQAMVDMLNYGAAVQKTLSYEKDDLANAGLTDTQLGYGTQGTEVADKYTDKKEVTTGQDHYMGSTIIVGNDLFLKIYFKNISDKTGYRAEISFTNHKGEEIITTVSDAEFWKGNETTYAVTVEQLVVSDISTLVTCTLYDAENNVVAKVTDSIGSYLSRMYAKSQEEIYLSVMKFCDSTHSYAHRNDPAE